MKSFIQITRHLYEEPYQLNLVIIASNGLASGGLEFYSNRERLFELGKSLEEFPSHEKSKFLFESGSEYREDRHAFYLRMRAKALNDREKCLLQIRLNNSQAHDQIKTFEDPQLTDFSIRTSAEAINRLGALLVTFSKLEHQRLYWSPTESWLDNLLAHKERQVGDVLDAALASLPPK